MNDSKVTELADLVVDRLCDKLSNVLFIGGVCTIAAGISIIAVTSITNIVPSFAYMVYKKRA